MLMLLLHACCFCYIMEYCCCFSIMYCCCGCYYTFFSYVIFCYYCHWCYRYLLFKFSLESSIRSACSVNDCGSEDVPLLVTSVFELSFSETGSAGVFWLWNVILKLESNLKRNYSVKNRSKKLEISLLGVRIKCKKLEISLLGVRIKCKKLEIFFLESKSNARK